MTIPGEVRVTSVVSRHHPDMPRLIVVPAASIAAWQLTGTTVVAVEINGTDVGRRTLKRWDDERWWIDAPATLCHQLELDVGSEVTVTLRLAETDLPDELAVLLARDREAQRRWDALTDAQRRMLREHILAAKQPLTRARRASKGLGRQ